ncbi:MAG: signal peptidase I [Bacillota bacterium]|nr:signal peptidase I [Bacillota bacterium]
MKTILHKLGAALPYLIFLLAVVLILNVVFALGRQETPSFLGYSVLHIKSGSMEPSIMTGDIIFVRQTDPEDLEVGDVITFKMRVEVEDIMMLTTVTHRIETISGIGADRTFTTKGDANNAADTWSVTVDQLVGRYVFRSVLLGNVFQFVTAGGSSLIYIGAIVLFLLIGLSEGASIVKMLAVHRKEQFEAEKKQLVAELKEAIRNEETATISEPKTPE